MPKVPKGNQPHPSIEPTDAQPEALTPANKLGYDPRPELDYWRGTPIPPVSNPLRQTPQRLDIANRVWWHGPAWTVLRNASHYLWHVMDYGQDKDVGYTRRDVPDTLWLQALEDARAGLLSKRSYVLWSLVLGRMSPGDVSGCPTRPTGSTTAHWPMQAGNSYTRSTRDDDRAREGGKALGCSRSCQNHRSGSQHPKRYLDGEANRLRPDPRTQRQAQGDRARNRGSIHRLRTQAHPRGRGIHGRRTRQAENTVIATVYTDEASGYSKLSQLGYEQGTVNHSAKNGIESVWALLKRGFNGVYHHWSSKHCHRYVNEFSFRLNEGNCQIDTGERLESLFRAMVGKTMTYESLTA